MNNSLRALTCAALLATAGFALADSESLATSQTSAPTEQSTKQQERLQDLRAQYEEKRDRITGADKLTQRRNTTSGVFFDAPVDTRDAPDQAPNASAQ